MPLNLAFATTIHKCQGISAGIVKEGQPPDTIKSIVFDPGTKAFESNCPGTFYVGLSQATTMGNNNKMKSAIYFLGGNINPTRLISMTQGCNKNCLAE